MTTVVTDVTGNRNDKIYNAAKVLGKSNDRTKVFSAIYKGKKKIKTVTEISKASGLKPKRVLEEGQKLFSEDLVGKDRVNSETVYLKKDFYSQHYKKIIAYAKNPQRLNKLPTKLGRSVQGTIIKVPLVRKLVNTKRITVYDIDSFSAIKGIRSAPFSDITESALKKGIQAILGEAGKFQDWGGENCDLLAKLHVGGKSLHAAFALKGKGTKGILTPAKMGKNGDQIQRLFKCPADVFLVVYHRQIAESVVSQMETHAIATSIYTNKRIYFGIIENVDALKLITAYKNEFS